MHMLEECTFPQLVAIEIKYQGYYIELLLS